MSNAQDLTLAAVGGNFILTGLATSFSSTNYDTNTFSNNLSVPYVGAYMASFDGVTVSNSNDGIFPQTYVGFMVDYGAVSATGFPAVNSALYDNQPVISWPKDQQIYYKVAGFNTNTQTYETWVIAEEITLRPETFDPTGNFPNIDYGIFFTPPSGNPLVNIKIVGRWIQ